MAIWIDAVSMAVFPGGGVRAGQVDALLAAVRDETQSSTAQPIDRVGTPPATAKALAQAPPVQQSSDAMINQQSARLAAVAMLAEAAPAPPPTKRLATGDSLRSAPASAAPSGFELTRLKEELRTGTVEVCMQSR